MLSSIPTEAGGLTRRPAWETTTPELAPSQTIPSLPTKMASSAPLRLRPAFGRHIDGVREGLGPEQQPRCLVAEPARHPPGQGDDSDAALALARDSRRSAPGRGRTRRAAPRLRGRWCRRGASTIRRPPATPLWRRQTASLQASAPGAASCDAFRRAGHAGQMVLEVAWLAADDQEALEDPVAPQDAGVIGAKKGSAGWAQTRPPLDPAGPVPLPAGPSKLRVSRPPRGSFLLLAARLGRLASGVVEQRHAELLSNLRQDLDDVEAAMRRLEDGTYGQCEVCATPLAVEQLQARPADRRCPTL